MLCLSLNGHPVASKGSDYEGPGQMSGSPLMAQGSSWCRVGLGNLVSFSEATACVLKAWMNFV